MRAMIRALGVTALVGTRVTKSVLVPEASHELSVPGEPERELT